MFDVIILGLGAMGSAASYHLAKQKRKVLGIDRFSPPHPYGSSHGQTRIIREAYFEHPLYVPLVQRAYELWAELEQQSAQRLFVQTGGLMIGPPEGIVFAGAKRSAEEHGLPHHVLDRNEVVARYPALTPAPLMAAVWEPRAGILFPEKCIQAHLGLARKQGLQLQLDEVVQSWHPDGSGIRVITNRGTYSAGQLVVSAGAWAKTLLNELQLPLQVERQVLFWFDAFAHPELFKPDCCPIYLWEYDSGHFFYGFPDLGDGIKVAGHHDGLITHPDHVDREIHADETNQMRDLLARFIPSANGALRSAVVCMYTNTPDGHFILGRHPRFPQVLIASPCSGHGFKFASAIGEVMAELLIHDRSRFNLSLFRLERFFTPRTAT